MEHATSTGNSLDRCEPNATILRYLIIDRASGEEGAGLGGIPPSAAEAQSHTAEAGGRTIVTGD